MGLPDDTNARFHYLTGQQRTIRLSTAFDGPTLYGMDSDTAGVLGKIGETQYRAFAMTAAQARQAHALPLGLAEGAKVIKPVKAGQYLTHDNCQADESFIVTQIRRRLDHADARFAAGYRNRAEAKSEPAQ